MRTPKKANLDSATLNTIAQFIFKTSTTTRRAGHGQVKAAASKWGVGISTVRRIWKNAQKQIDEGLPIHLTSQTVGHKKKCIEVSYQSIQEIAPASRKTIRALAISLTKKGCIVSKSTIGRLIKNGNFKAHTNSIKLALRVPNKLLRLQWSLKILYMDHVLKKVKFKSMHSTIHIDEKCFFISQATSRYYLAQGEEPIYRSCSSKSHITKVMFMCAVGRPCYTTSGEMIFDGKVGMFPLITKTAAKRRSKNRLAGVIEIKVIENVNKEIYKDIIINQIIPAVKDKWLVGACKNIILQQDNATPYITNDDPDFREAAIADGFNFTLVNQPPQSPDMNILDLDWFRAIQSVQQESPTYNIDALVKKVETSFAKMDPMKLNKVFLTLQSCMVEVLKLRGHNNYRIPHMKKDRLARLGILLVDLTVDIELVKKCIDYLIEIDQHHGLGELLSQLGY